ATSSRSARALPAGELARLGVPFFEAVEAVPEPERAVERARVLAGDDGAVLVTGSLYLLAALNVLPERIPWESSARGCARARATLLGLVPPFVGALIYMLFRPPEYLEDVRERELEIKAMEERLARGDLHCPVCRADVDPSFLVCPVCTTRLRQSCSNCKAPL